MLSEAQVPDETKSVAVSKDHAIRVNLEFRCATFWMRSPSHIGFNNFAGITTSDGIAGDGLTPSI